MSRGGGKPKEYMNMEQLIEWGKENFGIEDMVTETVNWFDVAKKEYAVLLKGISVKFG